MTKKNGEPTRPAIGQRRPIIKINGTIIELKKGMEWTEAEKDLYNSLIRDVPSRPLDPRRRALLEAYLGQSRLNRRALKSPKRDDGIPWLKFDAPETQPAHTGQLMEWIAKACFRKKHALLMEHIDDYRVEMGKAIQAGSSRWDLVSLRIAYWVGFVKATLPPNALTKLEALIHLIRMFWP